MEKLIYLIFFILSKLPLKILYLIGKLLKILNDNFIKYRLKIVNNNIRNAFPELTNKKKDVIQYKFYNNFFNVIVEIIKSISLTKKSIIKKVKIINLSTINKSIAAKKTIVLIGSHYSNWEWLFLRICLIKNIKLGAVYKPLSNKYFNYILLKIRSKFGAHLIPFKKWKYFILKNKKKPYVFMFIADQVPSEIRSGERINFLNQSTLFDKGPEKTAYLLSADVFYTEMIKLKTGYYSLDFKKINKQEITQEYAKLLNKTITNNPENWLWSHNRWKR